MSMIMFMFITVMIIQIVLLLIMMRSSRCVNDVRLYILFSPSEIERAEYTQASKFNVIYPTYQSQTCDQAGSLDLDFRLGLCSPGPRQHPTSCSVVPLLVIYNGMIRKIAMYLLVTSCTAKLRLRPILGVCIDAVHPWD